MVPGGFVFSRVFKFYGLMDYMKEVKVAITVCDKEGRILSMNKRSREVNGGNREGEDVYACHPEPARTMVRELMEGERTNVYTVEKKGVRKLIYQTPWYEDGVFGGLVEFSLELPEEMPHYVRTPKEEGAEEAGEGERR